MYLGITKAFALLCLLRRTGHVFRDRIVEIHATARLIPALPVGMMPCH